MNEQEVRAQLAEVAAGRLSRRQFVQTMVGLGLTAPLAARLLTPDQGDAQPRMSAFNPTRRGGGGPFRGLGWQAPTPLNPHFATGTKDQDGSTGFYEARAAYPPQVNLVPLLGDHDPSVRK